jgi:hypothetical protein
MPRDAIDPRSIWRQIRESNAHRTAGDEWFLLAVYGLWVLSFILSVATLNNLWLNLATAVLAATVIADLGWDVWKSSKALQAKAAAGIESAPLTPRDTAGCIIYGMGIGLMVSDLVLGEIFWSQHLLWIVLLVPIAWLPGLLGAALWLRLRRPHRL